MYFQPTVEPYVDFNDEEDAKALKQAFKGFGSDEEAIIDIITRRSNDQRLKIAQRFKTMYGKVKKWPLEFNSWSTDLCGRQTLNINVVHRHNLDVLKICRDLICGKRFACLIYRPEIFKCENCLLNININDYQINKEK